MSHIVRNGLSDFICWKFYETYLISILHQEYNFSSLCG